MTVARGIRKRIALTLYMLKKRIYSIRGLTLTDEAASLHIARIFLLNPTSIFICSKCFFFSFFWVEL